MRWTGRTDVHLNTDIPVKHCVDGICGERRKVSSHIGNDCIQDKTPQCLVLWYRWGLKVGGQDLYNQDKNEEKYF